MGSLRFLSSDVPPGAKQCLQRQRWLIAGHDAGGLYPRRSKALLKGLCMQANLVRIGPLEAGVAAIEPHRSVFAGNGETTAFR